MEIFGCDWHIWMTLVVFVAMYITLAKTKIHSDIVFFVVVVILTLSGCLSVKDVLSGFGSESVVVMGVLYIVIAGLEATGALNWIANRLLGTPASYVSALLRLMLPVSFLSAFINNPTVVTLFGKVSKIWDKTLKIPSSKLLIPISYAATLGGSLTILGTASNLIVANFFIEGTGVHIGLFDPFIPALACLVVGFGLTVLQRKYLPVRKTPENEFDLQATTMTTELTVPSRSHLIGLSLAESNIKIRNQDCDLIGIIHFDSEVEHVVGESDAESIYLMGGDTLVFTGKKESILNIARAYDLNYGIGIGNAEVKPGRKAVFSSLIMLLMIVLPAVGVIPLIYSCFLAAVLMLVTRCCSVKQGKKAINWDILVVYACSVSIGNAFCHTGIDNIVSDLLSKLCGGNALIAFITICAFTNVLTEFLSNPICAAVIAPIGAQMAIDLGANPITFCVGILIAVASCFATPIGSVTNLVVYTPGGYRFTDFTRIGIPINLAVLVTNIAVTLLIFPL